MSASPLNVAQPFFSAGAASDPVYLSHRDHKSKEEVRHRIERWWQQYSRYCPDAHFLSDARAHFVARTWELYLACTLLETGFRLEKTPSKGPDLVTRLQDMRVWMEAIAPGAGQGADAVPDRNRRGRREGASWHGHGPGEESLILRCTSAIRVKSAKYAEYAQRGIVSSSDAFVVAVSLAAIEDGDLSCSDLPVILKAVFPIGHEYWEVPTDPDGEEGGIRVGSRTAIAKAGGELIPTTFFTSSESSRVSGLLYSHTGVWNAPERVGNDMVLVHNPMASVPLPRRAFPFVRQEFVSDGRTVQPL